MKGLDEIYKIYTRLHRLNRSALKNSAKFRQTFSQVYTFILKIAYFFPKDSYLGVLRLFLRVLEVARSRRLGIAGEVSVWQIPENSVNLARVTSGATFLAATFLRARIWTGVFLMGKTINDRFANKKLLNSHQ